jgi:hypothetical protein
VIQFLVAEKESVGNIHKRLCNIYGSATVDGSTAGRWEKRKTASEPGKAGLHGLPRSGRPLIAVRPEMLQLQRLRQDVEGSQEALQTSSASQESCKNLASARPQTNLKTREAITKFDWRLLHHTPYSPDVAPSDFHLFGALKDDICGRKFQTDDDVICAGRTWLLEQDKARYRLGIHTLIPHWRKDVEID